jgi:hypothetical protein
MNIASKIKKHGVLGSAKIAVSLAAWKAKQIRNAYYRWAVRKASRFNHPTVGDMVQIEKDLIAAGVTVYDYEPRVENFVAFQETHYFPLDYHGGINGPVWDEKLLEHWIAAERLGLESYQPEDIYIDIAAANSPWAKTLRERLGIQAFAIDLSEVGVEYKDLPYYKIENATASSFADGAVSGASLQCAYEMFMGNDDTNLLGELARILKPGGKVVIVPLYMHTHYCAYSSPAYYGKGNSDVLAQEYVCTDWYGIPSARFYDANSLKKRVLDPIERLGMSYKLLVLRNKADLGKSIYCHFILEITK